MKKVTMREIAARCQVAPSTVARALTGNGVVDTITKQQIVRTAQELHYRSRNNRPCRWALLISSRGARSYYESELLWSLCNTILTQKEEYVIIPVERLEMVHDYQVDGVFLFYPANPEVLQKLSVLPVIVFNSYSQHKSRVWSVSSDDEEMICRAVEYFSQCGHRKLGMWIFPGSRNYSDMRREKYFREIVTEYGLMPFTYFWESHEMTSSEFSRMFRDEVTAILLPGEFSYEQIQLFFRFPEFRVPERFSLIMLENRRFSAYLSTPLTTFEQDFKQLSSQAFELAHHILSGRTGKMHNIRVPYLFNERSSVQHLNPSGELHSPR